MGVGGDRFAFVVGSSGGGIVGVGSSGGGVVVAGISGGIVVDAINSGGGVFTHVADHPFASGVGEVVGVSVIVVVDVLSKKIWQVAWFLRK